MKKLSNQILAIYIRVSTPNQAEKGISMHNQEQRGIELAKQLNWGYEVFKDAGITAGLPFKDRPALNEIVDRIYAGEIHGLYSIELDRLSRNVTDGNIFLSLLIEKNTKLFDYTGLVDLNDDQVLMMQQLKLIIGEKERKGISRKVKTNMERRIIDGKAPSGKLQAYGYDKDEKGYLIIHEEEAKVIRILFDLANSGNSVMKIAAYLNKLNYKTKVGKNWTGRYVYNTVTKSMYKGDLLHGDDGKKPGHTYSRKVYPCPAIIDPVLYDNVQTQLKERNTFKDTTNDEYFLLKGLLYCNVCGKGYFVHKPRTGETKLNTYQCKSGQVAAGCGNKGLYVSSLDRIVTDNVLNLVGIVEEAFSDGDLAYRTKDMIQQAKIAKEREERFKTEKQRLIDSIVKGGVNPEDTDIAKKMDEYTIGIKGANDLYNDCQKELQIVNHKERILEICKQGVASFKKMKNQKDKVDFLRSIISKVKILYTKQEKVFDIWINFKINQLEKYLIIKNVSFKTPLVRNESINKPNVLSEKISLEYLINIDEETEEILITQPTINYEGWREKHLPKTVLPGIMQKKVKAK